MTTIVLSADALRMPLVASAEPCGRTQAARPAYGRTEARFGAGAAMWDGGSRAGGITRPADVGSWHSFDQAQLAGGGPLRG